MTRRSLRRVLFGATATAFLVGATVARLSHPIPAIAQNSTSRPILGTAIPGTPTLAPLVKMVSPAVVNINVTGRKDVQVSPFPDDPIFRRFFNIPEGEAQREFSGAGSGVVLDAKHGYVVTNSHVIDHATEITVSLADERQFDAEIVGSDPETDLAVLRIPADNLVDLPLGDTQALQVGDFVVAIGQPFGLRQTVTSGIVSAVGRSGLNIEGYENFIQTDASINPGNSGGALVNLNGELVGINTAIFGANGGNVGIGFAIPVDMVSAVTKQLIAHGKVVRGQLGVFVQDIAPDVAKAMGLDSHDGALVSQVEPGSAAEKAGIEAGDVILRLNGTVIRDASDLRNRVGLMAVDESLTLTVVRDHEERTITARLRPRPSTETAARTVEGSRRMEGVDLATADPSTPGVRVAAIDTDSRAYQTGLRVGDVITRIDREPVTNVAEFEEAVGKHEGPLLLDVQRGDRQLFLVVR